MKNPLPTLFSILLATLGVRLLVSFLKSDLHWADEHFQSLEPAHFLTYGFGDLTWEWKRAFRSWTVPLLYTPVFWICHFLGIESGVTLTQIARVLTALASILSQSFLLCSLLSLGVSRTALAFVSGILLLNPALQNWSVAPLADTWVYFSIPFAPALFLSLLSTHQEQPLLKKRTRSPVAPSKKTHLLSILAGSSLTFPILLKPQMIPWSLSSAILILLLKSRWTQNSRTFTRKEEPRGALDCLQLRAFTLGLLFPLFTLGIIDFLFGMKPFEPLWHQMDSGAEIAKQFGVSPSFLNYFSRISSDLGLGSALLFACSYVFCCVELSKRSNALPRLLAAFSRFFPETSKRKTLQKFKRLPHEDLPALSKETLSLSLMVFPALVHFCFISWIAHKETRFALPIYASLQFCFFWTAHQLSKSIGLRILNWIQKEVPLFAWIHRTHLHRTLMLILALGFVLISGKSALHHRLDYSEINTLALEDQIRQLAKDRQNCAIFVDHHWSFRRGQMGLGPKIQALDQSLSEVQISQPCAFWVVRKQEAPKLLEMLNQRPYPLNTVGTPMRYSLHEQDESEKISKSFTASSNAWSLIVGH